MEQKFDNETFKLLEIINRCTPISKEELLRKSGIKSYDELEHKLSRLTSFISYPYKGVNDKRQPLIDNTIVKISDKGRVYVEEYSSSKFSDKFTKIISVVALIISVLSLIVSFLKGG